MTTVKCLEEINKSTKEIVLKRDPSDSPYLNKRLKWKNTVKFSKNPSNTSTNRKLICLFMNY